MNPMLELCDDRECAALEAFLIERIYEFNLRVTGYDDARLLGGSVRDAAGMVVAGFNGHTWEGCCEIAHLWVHESRRRSGLGRAMLLAAEAEAARRGCEQVVVRTHDFQAPGFYERMGYRRIAVIPGLPKDHEAIVYLKRLA